MHACSAFIVNLKVLDKINYFNSLFACSVCILRMLSFKRIKKCNMVVRVQMGGVTGRAVQSNDSPMFASSGYKCNVDAAVVYG